VFEPTCKSLLVRIGGHYAVPHKLEAVMIGQISRPSAEANGIKALQSSFIFGREPSNGVKWRQVSKAI
jgi:hypothetical protein